MKDPVYTGLLVDLESCYSTPLQSSHGNPTASGPLCKAGTEM